LQDIGVRLKINGITLNFSINDGFTQATQFYPDNNASRMKPKRCDKPQTSNVKRQKTNLKRQTPNVKRQTTNDKPQTTNDKRQTPNVKQKASVLSKLFLNWPNTEFAI
jgi:hypothetical protein